MLVTLFVGPVFYVTLLEERYRDE